jgi:hypothetical protein
MGGCSGAADPRSVPVVRNGIGARSGTRNVERVVGAKQHGEPLNPVLPTTCPTGPTGTGRGYSPESRRPMRYVFNVAVYCANHRARRSQRERGRGGSGVGKNAATGQPALGVGVCPRRESDEPVYRPIHPASRPKTRQLAVNRTGLRPKPPFFPASRFRPSMVTDEVCPDVISTCENPAFFAAIGGNGGGLRRF